MAYEAKGARHVDPMEKSAGWFDPLGRDRRVRREAAPPVEVIEEADGSLTIVTHNRT